MEHAKETADNLMADFEPDHEMGELIPEHYLTAADSTLTIGEEVLIRVRVPWRLRRRRGEYIGQLMGRLVAILPGHRLAYIVQVYEGQRPWPPQIVNPEDIAGVRL